MKLFQKLTVAAACLVILTGCSTHNRLAYFQDVATQAEGTVPLQKIQVKIEPDDELMINVSSEFPEATAIYNLPFNNPGMREDLKLNSTVTQKQTYIVNKEGDITFPVLGKIHVAGMTTMQLADELTRRIAADVEAPYVRVELVNFNVNVMGEVQQPGHYKFDTERVTVIDALARAGDMTVFGKRDNVTVWREENGKMTYHHLNLNDSKIHNSPYYYLKQNDMVYVEPSEARAGQAEYNQNNSYKVSVVSAIVSGLSVVASLVIALVINK